MKRFLTLLALSFAAASCDSIGSSKIKNLVDLTPKLEVEAPRKHLFSSGMPEFSGHKLQSYRLSKGSLIAEPVLNQGIIYGLDKEGRVNAFSLESKKILWTKSVAGDELDKRYNNGGVLFNNGKLYVTYGMRYLVVLDANTGNELIRKEFPDVLRTKPVMATDRLLLVQTISNQVVAYDIHTSKLVWMHEGGIETISSRNHVDPVIYRGAVLVSYSSGEVVYLNTTSGTELWRYNLTSYNEEIGVPSLQPSVIVTKPIIKQDFVYFATSNGKVVKVDLRDGTEVWSKQAEDVQTMILHDNNLILTNNARQVAVLSSADGKVLWVGSLFSEKERNASKPKTSLFLDPFVVKNDTGYILNVVATNGQLYQFKTNEDGELATWPIVTVVGRNINYVFTELGNRISLITNIQIMF